MNRTSAAALCACIGALCPPVEAQADDRLQFTEFEQQLFGKLAEARRHDAVELSLADIKRTANAVIDAKSLPRSVAFAEYSTLRLAELSYEFTEPKRLLAAYEELVGSRLAQASPYFRDLLQMRVLQVVHDLGDIARVNTLVRELGFVEDWWMIGPFDNERGRAFGRGFGPDREIEFASAYKGKKRDVRWRRVPSSARNFWIDLGTLLRPSTQAMCFVATCVVADAEKDAVLRLGSSGAFEVALNGKHIGGRNLRRAGQYDQDAIRLPLRAGRNLLVLRVYTQENDLAFCARLRDERGGPLKGVSVSVDANELTAATATPPRDSTLRDAPFLGARSVFGEEPADAYRLASALEYYATGGYRDRRAQELLQRTVDAMPDAAEPRNALAGSRESSDQSAAEKDDNARRHDYELLLQKHGDHVEALLSLAELELENTTATARAEELLARAEKLRPQSRHVALIRADVLEAAGFPRLAHRALLRAAAADEHGNVIHEALRRVAHSHARRGRLAMARAAFEQLLSRSFSADDSFELATVLQRNGKRDAALALFTRAARLAPFTSGVFYRHTRLLEAEEKFDQAMVPMQQWLAVCPEDDFALIELARLHGLTGKVDQQREMLRAAVTLNPNRKADRRRLEFLEAGEKPFYTAYELDGAKILAADSGPPADAAAANDPYHYVLDQRVVHAYRNGTTSEYRHLIVRILNDQGSRQFARYSVNHYWYEQNARLLEVKVRKGDDDVRRPRLRGTSVTMPTLAKGDTVEIRYRVDDTAPTFFGNYFGLEHRFARGTPTRRSELIAVLDTGRTYQLQTRNGAPQPAMSKDAAGNAVWRFEMRDLARSKPEPAQPDDAESKPLCRITTYESWNAFAVWWWNLIKEQSEVSTEIRRKVEELTAGLTTKKAKIQAIYKFVTTDVRYEAWEFGVHGYKPYSTPVIFERRHGDCKDKSLLLNCMLSVLGIRAYPVLIRADSPRSKDDLSLPMVEHFNHCISYVEPTDETPGMFLDGTATYHPIDTLPDMDRGAEVLVVRGTRGRIEQIPWPRAEDNRDEERMRMELAPSGDATIRYSRSPTLNHAVWVREYFGNEPAKQRERLEKLLRRGFGAVQIDEHRIENVADLNKPVVVEVRFKSTRFAVRQGKGLLLKSAIGVESLSPLVLSQARTKPLLLDLPETNRATISYVLPAGFRALNLPDPVELKQPFGSFRLTWKRRAAESGRSALLVTRELRFDTNRVEPKLYSEFREFATQVDQASQQVVLIEKEGAR